MKEKINIFTCCNGPYIEFIPIFILSHLYHNPECFVEIGYDGKMNKQTINSLAYVNSLYEGSFLVKERRVGVMPFGKGKEIPCTPNLTRFIVEPDVKADYVYVSDIDIICLQKGILDIHVKDMERTGLPYSNIVRKRQSEDQKHVRLTGLHFSPWKNFYPIPEFTDLIKQNIQGHDEVFLYEMVKKRFPDFDYENTFRPVHGIHVSLNRQPVGELNWGIEHWKKQWNEFRKTPEFLGLEEKSSPFMIDKIQTIDKYAVS